MRRLAARFLGGLVLGSAATQVGAAGSSTAAFVRWIGGPTMVIRFGPIRLLTDPVLGEGPQAFHSTFSLYREPVDRFIDAARARSLKVARPKEGQEIRVR